MLTRRSALPLLLLLAAALVALAVLFAPGAQPAQAQSTESEVWSATLTAAGSGSFKGYISASVVGTLTDNTLSYGGVDYEIERVTADSNNGLLILWLNKTIPDSLKSALTLHVGNRQFPLADATLGNNNKGAQWSNTGLSWSVGDTIQLRLTELIPTLLDSGFSGDGKVTTRIGSADDLGYAVALQPDGKIVMAGYSHNGSNNDLAVARYNRDGSPDRRFSGDGKVTTAFGSGDDAGYAVAVQPDGKIVVAGSSHNGNNLDFAVARYHANGALDSSFGSGGKVTTAFGSSDDEGYAVAVQPDGKIVVAGYSATGTNNDFALARYNRDGSLDTSFGSGGKVTTAFGSADDEGNAMALRTDGKIVVAGSSYIGSNDDFAVARYNRDGSLDTSFGTGGKVTTTFGSGDDYATGVALQFGGRIVVAGYSNNSGNDDFAVARYNRDGSLDTFFSGDGKVTTRIGSGADQGQAVAVQPDGKIVVAGYSNNGSNDDFAVARYHENGAPDGSFSRDGMSGTETTAIGSGNDYGRGVAVQSDGKIVVAGTSNNGSDEDFALAQYAPPTLTLSAPRNATLREGGGPVTITYTLKYPAPCLMGVTTTFGGTASGLVVQNDWYLEGDRLEQWIEEFNEQNDPSVSGEPDLDVDFGFSRPPHIEKGGTTATQTIVVIDDSAVDHGETLVLTAKMSAQHGCDARLEDDINFTIRDNERDSGRSDRSTGRAGSASPTRLTLSADKTTVREGEDSEIRVNATLDKPALSPTSVMVAFSGTAARNPNNTSDDGKGFAREGDYDVYLREGAQEYRILINAGETTSVSRDDQGNIQTELPMVISLYDDGEVESTETIILTATVDKPELTRTLRLSIRDNDRAGVTVSPTRLGLGVGAGDFEYYTVKLDSKPTADVTITPTSGNTGRVTVSPAALTFTSSNWKREQRVTVTRVAAGSATITHRSTSDDSNYRRSAASVTVPAAANPRHVTLSFGSPWVRESDKSAWLIARVDAPTLSDVEVAIAVDSASTATRVGSTQTGSVAEDYSGLGATITIRKGKTTGTLTIPIVHDYIAEDDETIVVTGTSPGATVSGTTLTILQSAGLIFSKPSLSLATGASGSYTVKLNTRPMGNVTINWSVSVANKLTFNPTSLTFTPSNWDTPQTVTVTRVGQSLLTVTHTGSSTADSSYNGGPFRSMWVFQGSGATGVEDEVVRTYTVSSQARAVEGQAAALTLTLIEAAPAGGVEFTVAANPGTAGTGDVGAIASPVTVPEGDTTLAVAIPTADDAVDEDDESFTVTVTAVTLGWLAEAGEDTATVTIEDDDTAGVTVNAANPLNVDEGGTATYTVVLDSRPTHEVTIDAVSGDDDAATVFPASFTIAPENWNVPETFLVSGASDADTNDETVGISHRITSQDGKYAVAVGSVSVAVSDTTQNQEQSPAGKYAELIAQMYEWRNDPQWKDNKTHTDRWDRALLAFGETVADASLTAMPASEAQGYADQAWGARWVPVAAAMWELENRAPTVSAALGDVTVINQDASGAQTVSLSGVFSDADGDELTFSAASSDETVALAIVTADQTGLLIIGNTRGTATVTVTADDGKGGTVADAFTVTVKAAPVVASAISDLTGLGAGATQEASLSGVFSDADGDALTITAASSDEAKATVTVASDQSNLTVAGVAEGTAAITVTAQDTDGNRVSDTFDVAVTAAQQQQQDPPPNQSPTVSSAIADATIVNQSGTKEVSLSGVFDDPDNDELSITAASSNESIAAVSVAADYSTLTVTAQARGTATITVTADDGNGGTVSDSFTVTVKAAPVVASAIADVSGLEEGASQDISLSGVFSDADGDTLSITAASSDSAKATATVASDGSKLTVAGVAEGTASITVTARDADGNSVSDTFEVSVVKKYAALIAQMYQWRNDPQWVDNKEHTDRWDRALLALGETVADTSLTPMTAAEAQELADRGWQRWEPVAKALKEIEGG